MEMNRQLHGGPRWISVILFHSWLLFGCGGNTDLTIEKLSDQRTVPGYRIVGFYGVRDGDKLSVTSRLESSTSSLELDLSFEVGVPTRLISGDFLWHQPGTTLQGRITARSVTFLGGQSDRPALGGVFELLSSNGLPAYRVSIPTQEIGRRPTGALPRRSDR